MIFWMIIGLLLASVFIVTPFLKAQRTQDTKSKASSAAQQTNVALFREQIDNLKLQLRAGEIDNQQYQQLESELQKQLLSDTPDFVEDIDEGNNYPGGEKVQQTEDIYGKKHRPLKGLGLLIACVLLLPLMSLGLYTKIGSAADMKISQMMEQLNQPTTSEAQAQTLRSELLKRMMQRLNSQPEHVAYLVSTARLLLDQQQFLLAASYYQKAVAILPEQPEILAEYAQANYFAAGNRLTPVVEQALEQALNLDPGNPTALGLQGISYYSSGDYQQALTSWQQALRRIPPQSQQAQSLIAGVEQARLQLQNAGGGEGLTANLTDMDNNSVVVHLRLDQSLQASPDQVIYLFAREVDGSPMPLAVRRLRVADLPVSITLDDSMAMPGGKKLSSAEQIQLVARVSSTGTVNRQPEDLEGQVDKVSISEAAKGVELVIDKPVSAMGL